MYDLTVILRRLNCIRSDRDPADRDSGFFSIFVICLLFSPKLHLCHEVVYDLTVNARIDSENEKMKKMKA